MTPKYRPDIDGLRAVAVLSVLFFHVGIQAVSGGYVGVDIFFVISGFLITSIIVREIESNSFSISRFYERRFRRILPALAVVIAVSIIIGAVLLQPDHLRGLGKSAIATSAFSSNILFYLESGYFDSSSEFKPLLHTWSLGVEEQYYIFFPILLIIIARLDSKKYARWLIPLTLLSFLVCVLGMQKDASASFYLIPARAWELFIGSVLSLHLLPMVNVRWIRDLLSMAGILLIGFSLFFYTSETPFPGTAALVPTLGGALIIYSGSSGDSFVGRILSLKPFVFIGLISYSLYLWHWPIIVYAKYYSIFELGNIEIAVLILVIFTLSILTWRYVEAPFRRKDMLASKAGIFIASTAVSILVFSVGAILYIGNGLPDRLSDNGKYKYVGNDVEWEHWGGCEREPDISHENYGLCTVGNASVNPSFVLWGDSHAKAFASSIDLSAKRMQLAGSVAIRNACPPLLSVERKNRTNCYDFNERVLKYIATQPNIKTVVLVSRWAISANGTRYKREAGNLIKLVDLNAISNAPMTNLDVLEAGLRRTIEQLHKLGKSIVIVNTVPEIGYDVPSASYVAALVGNDVSTMIAPSLIEYNARNENINELLLALGEEYSVKIIETEKFLCSNELCEIIKDGNLIYRDNNHLSTFGAKYIARIFEQALNYKN